MTTDILTLYIQASSKQTGALGIFHVYGGEGILTAELDARIRLGAGRKIGNALSPKEIRYGWLTDAAGREVDEVMLARPRDAMRVLMTHGGAAICEAARAFLRQAGFAELTDLFSPAATAVRDRDELFQPVLTSCITETQVAAVLKAMAQAEATGKPVAVPKQLLATHRLLLAGPPNAGKSSLLNRLVGYDRAFVHEEAGATRDVVDELVDLAGYAVLVGDMPGYTGATEGLDAQAWALAAPRLRLAEAVLFVVDASRPWDDATERAAATVAELLAEADWSNDGAASHLVLVVLNKTDLPPALSGEPWRRHFPGARAIRVCSLPDGDAREKVEGEMAELLVGGSPD